MRLERRQPGDVDWAALDAFDDRVVFQTREWLEFLARSQDADPVVAELRDRRDVTAGWFTGAIVRRFGLRILGSPMPGWTTAYMGFNLEPGVSRRGAVEALLAFAFGPLRCAHLELRDHRLSWSEVEGLGFGFTPWHGVEVDLRGSEEEVMGRMKGPARTAIRKAAKQGVEVVEATADPGFADELCAQLGEVFAKQGLLPPFGPTRIRVLQETVGPTGRLLCLRAITSEGECAATGIFPAAGGLMHFLSGASWRRHQHLRPNEAVMWAAMRHWRERGVERCDLGGLMDYKRKYGPRDVYLPFLRTSRFRAVAGLRELARGAREMRRRVGGRRRSPARGA